MEDFKSFGTSSPHLLVFSMYLSLPSKNMCFFTVLIYVIRLDEATNAHLYGWTVILGNLAILLWTYYYVPFHVKLVNIIVITAFSTSLMPALIAYFASLANTSGPYAGVVLILMIPAGVAGITKIKMIVSYIIRIFHWKTPR